MFLTNLGTKLFADRRRISTQNRTEQSRTDEQAATHKINCHLHSLTIGWQKQSNGTTNNEIMPNVCTSENEHRTGIDVKINWVLMQIKLNETLMCAFMFFAARERKTNKICLSFKLFSRKSAQHPSAFLVYYVYVSFLVSSSTLVFFSCVSLPAAYFYHFLISFSILSWQIRALHKM